MCMAFNPPFKPIRGQHSFLRKFLLIPILALLTPTAFAQIDEDQLGGWYSWFYNRNIDGTPWATQMIIQRRNWDVQGDLQQRLILGQVSIKPEGHPLRYGVGYYHLRHGTFGPSSVTRDEHILFQQGIYSTKLGIRNYFTGRIRLEEHWPDGREDFRRLRTFLSLNRPLNQDSLDRGAVYLSFYDEYFADLENIHYALNRVYAGIGWKVTDHTSWQIGIMRQSTRSYGKNQLMVNLFHHY